MTTPNANKQGLELTTGSRLHFGLYRFAPKDPAAMSAGVRAESGHLRDLSASSLTDAWYGGVGLMIQDPATVIEFQPHVRLEIASDPTGRALSFVDRWFQWMSQRQETGFSGIAATLELPVRLTIRTSPPQHCGLGAGTQLALAIGQGLTRFFLDSELAPEELANCVGRGLRSAIGTHGFFRGGLIVDRGKRHTAHLGTLDGAFRLPEAWRILLILQRDPSQIHGSRELQAFKELPEIPQETTARLQSLTRDGIVPAVLAGNFEQFANCLYAYGLLAGQCFNQIQGGPFASERAQWWVDQVRGWGFSGVGQSSWGPTLFCFAADPDQALWLRDKINGSLDSAAESVLVTQPQAGPYQIKLPQAGL
jgi:beta-ribofuranosylaminobenzene 5'-phosphate synthase